jgi:dehydrogenase/reductase SDR family protein 7B
MDVGDLKSITSITTKANAALAIYNSIHILVNNAGILQDGTVLENDIEVDKRIMDVNYFGALALTKGKEIRL